MTNGSTNTQGPRETGGLVVCAVMVAANYAVKVRVNGRVRVIVNHNIALDVHINIKDDVEMNIISFANPKGGSGKTTSAMLLAEQIARAGARVAVLDLDPNANIVAWSDERRRENKGMPFDVFGRPGAAEETVALLDDMATRYDYVIVDLEGSKDQIVTFALARTDLCIIPLDGSAMEARQAAAAVSLVQTTSRMIRQRIAYALLFTRTVPAFESSDERRVRAELAETGITSIIPVRLAKRSPYTRIFSDSMLLSEIFDVTEREVYGKSASVQEVKLKPIFGAIANAEQYAQAVVNMLADIKKGA